jgi:hypothetical protein
VAGQRREVVRPRIRCPCRTAAPSTSRPITIGAAGLRRAACDDRCVCIGCKRLFASMGNCDGPFGSISKAGTSGDGAFTLIFAVAAIFFGFGCLRGQPDRRKVAIVGTVLLGLSAAISVYDMSTLPIPSFHLVVVSVGVGVGLWLCAIGSIVGTGAGVIAIKTCTRLRTRKVETFGTGAPVGAMKRAEVNIALASVALPSDPTEVR